MARPVQMLVFGGRGGIGNALAEHVRRVDGSSLVVSTSRDAGWVAAYNAAQVGQGTRLRAVVADPACEQDLRALPAKLQGVMAELGEDGAGFAPDMVVNAVGVLHNDASGVRPETSLKKITPEAFTENVAANALATALVMKHLFAEGPLLGRKSAGVFAALSARVGSVSENRLGGWYSYRASKAALNQLVKTASVETARTHPRWCLLSYHPGTVASPLSDPFVRGEKRAGIITADTLDAIDAVDETQFSPEAPVYWSAEVAAAKFFKVLEARRKDEALAKRDSGALLDYAGRTIPF
eukprot:TRINITY_DN3931_c3_g1_i1.p1 TRINITY_DN3931_c3_g1~~TRINITY_DN3931_c3_g1_i1.p1  ORF type:complete len:296 (+),score=116.76 TRINITY_DN3931_c3_g1_i1:93-980(+)